MNPPAPTDHTAAPRPSAGEAARTSRRAGGDRSTDWTARANCRGVDPDLFFPGQGEPTDPAKAVCQGCVVRDDCLTYALTPPIARRGIWGGLSENERRKLRRARAQARRARELGGAA